MKEIALSVATTLAIMIVLWILGFLGRLPEEFVIPKNAVLAFESKECPNGWKEYKPAYGRFIRGIDRSGDLIDPQSERKPGSLQDDMFEAHRHEFDGATSYDAGSGAHERAKASGTSKQTKSTGGEETRPKNVALLYCVKT